MAIRLIVKSIQQQPKVVKLQNSGQFTVAPGDSIKVAGKAELKVVKRGSDLVIKDASGNEYLLKDFYNEASPAEKGQKLSWEDEQGGQKELLSNGPSSIGQAPILDESFGLFVMGVAGMAGVTTSIADNKDSNPPPEINASVGKVLDVNAAVNAIPSHAPNNTPVGITAMAFDSDPSNTVTYSLADDAGGRFKIDPDTGIVTVANGAALDLATAPNHVITVRATSSNGSYSEQDFTVNVIESKNLTKTGNILMLNITNDSTDSMLMPTYDPMPIDNVLIITSGAIGTVAENAPISTVIYDAAAMVLYSTTALSPDSDADQNTTLVYSLSGTDANLLNINSSTGEVTLKAPADFETKASYSFNVIATDTATSTQSATQAVIVNVTNVNEIIGTLTDSNAATNTVAENAMNNTAVGITALASDPDTTDMISYSLDNNAGGRFNIDNITGDVTVADGALLNYESASSHQITVRATSVDGSFRLLDMFINVTNLNEAPNIESAEVTLAENIASGTVVTNVNDSFTGTDLGRDNTPITYSITAGNADGIFAINSATGAITIAAGKTLDYESATSHVLTVSATDGTLSDTAVVTVDVTNVNEIIGTLTDSNAATNTVAENAMNNTAVGITALASDPDTTDMISYSLDNNAGGRFNIDNITGDVTVADGALLNYESASSHQITVRATSVDGSFRLLDMFINVTNVNEAPVITSGATGTVAENAPISTVIYDAAATDPDAGQTATLVYSLSDADAALLNINSSTGEVTLKASADYETKASYSFNVIATDAGSPSLSTTQAVTVNVIDVNEVPVNNAPDIVNATVTLAENIASGTLVTNISDSFTGTDLDRDGAAITYSITAGNADGIFTINSATGAITIATGKTLDYEAATSHALTISATDGSLSDTATITVNVTNVNELVSAVTDSNAAVNTVAENAANDTVVGITALATDPDAGDTVSYSLDNNAGGRFKIDSATGVVTVADGTLLNYETAASHTITVRASSSDGSASTANMTVNVTNVNEALVITSGAMGSVVENAPISTVIYDAAATDPDAGQTATLVYSLSGADAALLNINSSTGEVTLKASADYETKASYSFNVIVTDAGSPSLSTTQAVTVNVIDVNDTPIAVNDTASTDEDKALTLTSVQLLSNDTDLDQDNLSIVSVHNAVNGSVALVDGNAVFTPSANYSGPASFDYTITDSKGGNATATVNLTVNPVNDAPTATPVVLAPIAEDSSARTITQAELLANASDIDGPSLTVTNLAIASGNGTLVNNGNGTWNYTPATNDSSSVSFSYTVTDGSLTAAGSATLDITPVNDAPIAIDDTVTVDAGKLFTSIISLLTNDTDVDGPSKTAVAGTYTTAQGGTLNLSADGQYTYTPATGFSGTDTVSYSVTDGLLSDTGLLTITVNPAPVIVVPPTPVSYEDNVGSIKNSVSTATNTDDATPGIKIGIGLTDTPRLYIDGNVVASSYNAVTGTLTPINPVASGNHAFRYTLTNSSGVESQLSDALAIQTTAKIYYVSPSGLNTNNGTSLETPLLTINAALSKAVTGDTIYLMTGVYEEYVTINQNGITLAAYENSHPVIDGGNLTPKNWGSLLKVNGNDNFVYGIEVRNSNVNGVADGGYGVALMGENNTVSNMNVHHIWETGVIVHGDYNTVEYSTIWQASQINLNGAAPSRGDYWSSGLSAARGASGSEIPGITSYATLRYNEVYNNWGEGLSLYETANSVLEGNVVYDNWTVNLYLSDSTNSIVKGNLVYASDNPAIPVRNNNRIGITLADEVDAAPRSQNNIVIDNMIYNASFGAFTFTEISSNASGLKNVLIANNTVVNGNFSVGNAVNFTHTNSTIVNNIFSGTNNYIPTNTGISFSNNNWRNIPALGQSATDVVGNPLLAKTGSVSPGELTADYFRLLAGSPVIDKGAILAGVSDDYLGTPRDSAPDLGAYEYKISPNINATIAAGDVNLRGMFEGDAAYNQNIGAWDISAVVDMSRMFKDAKVFNQDIGNWDVSSLITADQMLDNSGMSDQKYDLLLAGWADVNTSSGETGLQYGVSFGAKGVQYTNATDMQYLVDQYGWTFTDGGLAQGAVVGKNQAGDVINLSSATTAQTVHGLGGNDTITGSAYADVLVGGAANDTLSGGAGRDIFSYRHTNEGADVITDFSNGAAGDVLDIHYLLDGATAPTVGDFVGLSNNNGKLQLNIDADGNGSGTDVSILLQNISYTTATSDPLFLQNMIANGNLVI